MQLIAMPKRHFGILVTDRMRVIVKGIKPDEIFKNKTVASVVIEHATQMHVFKVSYNNTDSILDKRLRKSMADNEAINIVTETHMMGLPCNGFMLFPEYLRHAGDHIPLYK